MDRSGPSTAPPLLPSPPSATAEVPLPPPAKVDPPKEEIVDSIPEEMDEEEALAERRRKRAAILSRFTAETSTAPSSAGPKTPLTLPSTVVVDNALGGGGVGSGLTSVAVAPTPRPTTPNGAFDLSSNDVSAQQGDSGSKRQEGGDEEVSAADYDAAADGQAEAVRRMQVATEGLKGEEKAREIVARETKKEMENAKRDVPEEEEEEDSEEDMFAVDIKPKKAKKVKVDVPVRCFLSPRFSALD